MNFALDAFSPRELTSLIKAAEQQKLRIAKRRPIGTVRAELSALAVELGYSIDEIFGSASAVTKPDAAKKPRKRRAGKAPIKYRDPENKRNTWSGRGSQPRWLREKVRRGLSAADFLLPGLAKPTPSNGAVGKRTVFKQS